MGLIKAGLGSVGGVLADQWKEFFTCDAMPKTVLARKGQKKTSSRSSNTKGSDNVISDGSGLIVADGQCAIITDQGVVAEFCAVPGEYTFNSKTEPSLFTGKFGDALKNTFKEIGKRFTYGGEPPKDQRVYYFNTLELMENPFGTPNPILFRVADKDVGVDLDVRVRCNGYYSYIIDNPIIFYTKVCGNFPNGDYLRSELDKQLKAEFIGALRPGLSKIAYKGVRPFELGDPDNESDIVKALNSVLDEKWAQLRGLKLTSIAFETIDLPEEDQQMLRELQRDAAFRNPTMAAAHLVGSQGQAMKDAAKNQSGAVGAFMGMGMAQNAGGANAASLFQLGQQQQAQQAAQQAAAPAAGAWTCPQCGKQATGKFCPDCGTKKPDDGWTCSCGAVNKGRFCSECGAKKPEAAPLYKCDKCGWEPEDPHNPPKFCPECGDPFDDKDKI